jgi:hypothetical protein
VPPPQAEVVATAILAPLTVIAIIVVTVRIAVGPVPIVAPIVTAMTMSVPVVFFMVGSRACATCLAVPGSVRLTADP